MYIIFTNNSFVAEFFDEKRDMPGEIKWLNAPAMDVLSAAKSAAHGGTIILSNPMSGVRTGMMTFDISPAFGGRPAAPPKIRSINPYLSILAEPSRGTVDFASVRNLDEALTIYKKNARLRFISHNEDTVKQFQAADLESLLATMAALENL